MIKTILKKGLQYFTKIGLLWFAGKFPAFIKGSPRLDWKQCDNCGGSFFDGYAYQFKKTENSEKLITLCADCANVKKRPEGAE